MKKKSPAVTCIFSPEGPPLPLLLKQVFRLYIQNLLEHPPCS